LRDIAVKIGIKILHKNSGFVLDNDEQILLHKLNAQEASRAVTKAEKSKKKSQ
jgi:hypothetical protein